MQIEFIHRIISLFIEWNEWTAKQNAEDLYTALTQKDYLKAGEALEKLRPWIIAFSTGDTEGKYYADRLTELKQTIDSQPKQLRLF